MNNYRTLECPECLRTVQIPLDSTKSKFRCRECKTIIEVPQDVLDEEEEQSHPLEDQQDIHKKFFSLLSNCMSGLENLFNGIKFWISYRYKEKKAEYAATIPNDLFEGLGDRVPQRLFWAFVYGVGAFFACALIMSCILSPFLTMSDTKYERKIIHGKPQEWRQSVEYSFTEHIPEVVGTCFAFLVFTLGAIAGYLNGVDMWDEAGEALDEREKPENDDR